MSGARILARISLADLGDPCYTAVAMLAAHAWAARLLTRYGPACQAQALGVWSCTHGRLDLVCDWLGNQRLHNLLHTRWPTLAAELSTGQPVPLADASKALPVRTQREGLLGALLFTGAWPTTGGVRALLDELVRRLSAALRDPLPPPQPEMLQLPLAQIDVPGGDAEAERRVYTAILRRYGGNVALAGQALRVPRQTLHNRLKRLAIPAVGLRLLRVVPEPLDLEAEALDLERHTCRLVLERCRGDARLSAAALHMAPPAWRSYLRALHIELPAAPRRSARRRHVASRAGGRGSA